jgi:sulfite reductase alpha subunit-like flavoprotein
MSDVDQAEKTLGTLRAKRDALVAHGHGLGEERTKLSFSAHAEADRAAQKRLDTLHGELGRFESELKSIDEAIAEATKRLAGAEQAAASAQDKAAARKVRELGRSIARRLLHADEFYAAAAEELNAANDEQAQINALGEAYPSAPQFRLNMIPALQTMVMSLPQSWWRDWSKFLAPAERRNFSGVWSQMRGPLENRIKQRLGESEPVGERPKHKEVA